MNAGLDDFLNKEDRDSMDNDPEDESDREMKSEPLKVDNEFLPELIYKEEMDLNNEDNKFQGPPTVLSLKHFHSHDKDNNTYYVGVRGQSTGNNEANLRLTNIFKKPNNTGKFVQEFVYSKSQLI